MQAIDGDKAAELTDNPALDLVCVIRRLIGRYHEEAEQKTNGG